MFGIGFSELLVILVVLLIFVGPEKLPETAKTLSKGIRAIRQSTNQLRSTIEDDEHIGGAVRDLRSALSGDPSILTDPFEPIKERVSDEPPQIDETTAEKAPEEEPKRSAMDLIKPADGASRDDIVEEVTSG